MAITGGLPFLGLGGISPEMISPPMIPQDSLQYQYQQMQRAQANRLMQQIAEQQQCLTIPSVAGPSSGTVTVRVTGGSGGSLPVQDNCPQAGITDRQRRLLLARRRTA